LPALQQKKTKPSGIVRHTKKISDLMLEKKALDIIIIDVQKITTLTDFFIICTSESEPQTRAITDHIYEQMKEDGIRAWHIEGYENLDWVLLDYVNIVVHVFSRESRSYYDLERLWADGKITQVHDKK
jgi:ribosome-associated protein